MKIFEFLLPSDQQLMEEIDRDNRTGLTTEDVVSIIKSQQGPWSKPMTGEELIAELDEMVQQHGQKG